jgi:hypothetical protein
VKKVLVLAYDNAALMFGVIPDFSVTGPIQSAVSNMRLFQTVELKMLNQRGGKLIVDEVDHADSKIG